MLPVVTFLSYMYFMAASCLFLALSSILDVVALGGFAGPVPFASTEPPAFTKAELFCFFRDGDSAGAACLISLADAVAGPGELLTTMPSIYLNLASIRLSRSSIL